MISEALIADTKNPVVRADNWSRQISFQSLQSARNFDFMCLNRTDVEILPDGCFDMQILSTDHGQKCFRGEGKTGLSQGTALDTSCSFASCLRGSNAQQGEGYL
jgi:hypothetical protein